jgi:RND family efflux transporter MFP subunit
MQKTKDFIKKYSRKKRAYAILVVVILIVFGIAKPKGFDPAKEIVETAHLGTLKKTVLATGTITSTTDLNLSFTGAGTVGSIRVGVGSVVKKGQILATLKAGSEAGALLQAQAELAKVREGSTSEEVKLAEVFLENAKIDLENTKVTQESLVQSARLALYNSGLVAIPVGSSSSTAPTISGTYTGLAEGQYNISAYATGSGGYFNLTGLESGNGQITTSAPTMLGTKGLFIQFPTGYSVGSGVNFVVDIPNTQASTYVANLNAYASAQKTRDSSIASAQALVNQRAAELALKLAASRPSDVLAAEAKVAIAQAAYEDKIIRAPADGTITLVDIKLGESPTAGQSAIVLQDVSHLYLEAKVNESDVSDLVLGQSVTFTADAFGTEEIFTGTLSHIDPAPTTDGSVVNYKINAEITSGLDKIKTGMTANMSVLVREKANVVIIPGRDVMTKDGKSVVEVVTDERRGKTVSREVTLGVAGDGATIEVTSGLKDGEKVLFRTTQ